MTLATLALSAASPRAPPPHLLVLHEVGVLTSSLGDFAIALEGVLLHTVHRSISMSGIIANL